MAVGGAAYLVAQRRSRHSRVLGFEDLGMEAIYEFEVKSICRSRSRSDSKGTSVHTTGPREWQARIGKIPVAVV